MQKISKRGWIEFAACLGAFIVLAVIAAICDLEINIALYNPQSLYGQFFARLGELPSYLAAPTVGVILFHQDFGKNKTQKILLKCAFAALIFAGWFYAIGVWFWENFISEEVDYAIVYKLFFCAVLTAGVILGTAKVDKKVMRKLLVLALFIAIAVAVSNLIVQIMKILWARQRFRTMVDNEKNAALIEAFVKPNGGDLYRGFTPWYRPNAIFRSPVHTDEYIRRYKEIDSDTFKSFPSGHTVAAAGSFALIILPEMYKKLAKHRWMFWVFPAIYTVLVGISRIVMGAHYLSDTLFGGYIGFGIAALARWIFVSKMDKIYACFKIPQEE